MVIDDSLRDKFGEIKMLVTDVDGVLTDGKIIYDDNGVEYKHFNVKDGLIVKQLRRFGIIVGVITGRDSKVVRKRCEELKFDFHFHGIKNKREALSAEMEKRKVEWSQVMYIGDDLNDLELIENCGIGCTPNDAPGYVAERADLVADRAGGEGAYREIADYLILSRGWMDELLEGKV